MPVAKSMPCVGDLTGGELQLLLTSTYCGSFWRNYFVSYLFPLLACFPGTAHNDKLKLWFHGDDMEGVKFYCGLGKKLSSNSGQGFCMSLFCS